MGFYRDGIWQASATEIAAGEYEQPLIHNTEAQQLRARLAEVEAQRDELQKKKLGRLRDDFTQWRSTHDDGCGQ
jgi:hypothetical protein